MRKDEKTNKLTKEEERVMKENKLIILMGWTVAVIMALALIATLIWG